MSLDESVLRYRIRFRHRIRNPDFTYVKRAGTDGPFPLLSVGGGKNYAAVVTDNGDAPGPGCHILLFCNFFDVNILSSSRRFPQDSVPGEAGRSSIVVDDNVPLLHPSMFDAVPDRYAPRRVRSRRSSHALFTTYSRRKNESRRCRDSSAALRKCALLDR